MKRRTLKFGDLRRMMPEKVDRLPSPAEFRCDIKGKTVRLRKRWVGFGWVDEGKADGTEPLLVID